MLVKKVRPYRNLFQKKTTKILYILRQTWRKRRIRHTKHLKKIFFQFFKYDPKLDVSNLQSPKKPRKLILYDFGAFGVGIRVLKTKNAILPRNTQKTGIFEISIVGRVAGVGRKLADLWPGGPFSPKVFPKFFLSQTDKN